MSNKHAWREKGLRFQCTQCGKCCTGPGFVWVKPSEVQRLADHLKISEEEFRKRYTRIVDGRACLTEKKRDEECVFLENNQCSVYEARPLQCRSFPWWFHNLQSKKDWKATGEQCEGVNHPDAPLIPWEKIHPWVESELDALLEEDVF